jgi:site-specific recombinase XerD
MRVSELCGLRLADVDHEQKALRVQRAGGSESSLTLSSNGWFQLRSYLEQYRPKEVPVKGRAVEEEHLFLSEGYQPLTSNGITLVFHRLGKRAGISDKPVSPSALRDTCAARFLSAGGTLQALGDQLGLRDLAALKRYERAARPPSQTEPPKKPVQVQGSRPKRAVQTSKQRSRAGTPDGSERSAPVSGAEDDP